MSDLLGEIPSDWGLRQGAWHRFSPSLVATAWHLYRGGITDLNMLRRALGQDVHLTSLRSAIAGFERLVHGPLGLSVPVRCCSCGCAIVEIPCRACHGTGRALLYRPIEPRGKPAGGDVVSS